MKTAVLKPLKALNPRTPDTKYTGSEPEWRTQPDSENRNSRLGAAFHWYGYHYGKKEVKEFIIDWLSRTDRIKEAKEFARVPESTITNVYGWLARMSLMGLELTEHEQLRLDDQIAAHIRSVRAVKEVVEKVEDPVVPKITIQDRLREKMTEAAGEIEGMFDEMIAAGAKMSADYKPMALLRGMNIAPQMVGVIADDWKRRMTELQEATAGKDPQLVEGYSNFSKIQLRNLIKFCEQVIADCGNYVQIKKVERKPRAKKAVSPEKLASKFKFLKDFAELKLASESPAKLVGASEAYLYDTKKRKLVHVIADQHVGTFTVKGSSIVGFDTANSQQKTLRKPAEQLKALLGSGKPAARKFFKDIRATEIRFNGRGNENLIILKTY
jgi:hypothetical protein